MAVDKIWVFAESADGKPTTVTLELLTKARELASTVEALYAGADADAIAATLGEHGATKLFVIDPGDGLPGQVAAAAIAQLAGEHNPNAILFAQSYDGRDAIARLSVKLDRPVLTNGTSLGDDGGLLFGTAIFGGVTLVDVKLTAEGPALIAIRPKSFAAEESGGGAAEVANVAAADAGRAAEAKVLARHVEEQQGPKLEEATVVVSGGRGIGAAENYAPLVEELAKQLKGAWGASRHRRRRLGAVREAGRSDRQDRQAEAVHRARHLGRDAAPRRHEEQRQHPRHQQGRRGADLLGRRPRHRRRRAQGRARDHRGDQSEELGTQTSPSMRVVGSVAALRRDEVSR